ncbi:hypothetical protein EXT65_21135 [Pectobacterium carotovorum subsp. carotovorum]|nr:hypothetical protein [Pectobacterium carotovorum]MCL6336300.1 hypothetical protein [Pectobacterium carotovorum subsp. carotovorum]
MKPLFYVALFVIVSAPGYTLTLTPSEEHASEKIRFMQSASGTDHSKMAAYIQADQTFTQWCDRTATVNDLKRISSQEGFEALYNQMKNGKTHGMTQTKGLLFSNNPKFCRG